MPDGDAAANDTHADSNAHASALAVLRLTLTPGLGPVLIARLLARFGSAEAAGRASVAELTGVEGIGRDRAESIRHGPEPGAVEREREVIDRLGARLISIEDAAAYPPLLRAIPDPPPLLYVRGEFLSQDVYALGVVGTRHCTAYGRDQTGRLVPLLAQAGFTIVSGGARGVDTEAHRGALRASGRTVVVLGCGLSETYPPENRDLFDSIVAQRQGAIVSELPMAAAPARENFPRRNRIISGLALATLVIEAGEHSGALITARLACEEHNREVLAVPGRIDSRASAGCNRMIREGWARLVTGAQDILEALEGCEHLVKAATGGTTRRSPLAASRTAAATNDSGLFNPDGLPSASVAAATATAPGRSTSPDPSPGASPPSLAQLNLTPTQRRVLDALDGQPLELTELAARTGLALHTLQADITILQIRGLVARTGPLTIERRRPAS